MVDATDEPLPPELQQAHERHARQQEGRVKVYGPTSAAEPREVMRHWLPVLTEGLERALAENPDRNLRDFVGVIRELDRDKLALCLLHGALEAIERQENYLRAAKYIANNIYWECFALGLFKHYRHKYSSEHKAAKAVQEIETQHKSASSQRARTRLRTIEERKGYKLEDWNDELRLIAGNWGIDQLLRFLRDVFTVGTQTPRGKDDHERRPEKVLKLTPEAREHIQNNVNELIHRYPVWLPMTQEPLKWTAWNKGVTSEKHLARGINIVGHAHQQTIEAISKAIRNGKMKSAVDALNALQAVPWKINKPVLAAIRSCAEQGVVVKGMPGQDDGERVVFCRAVETAEKMTTHERFWTPMRLDWRSRVYGLPSFNFQGRDYMRALFLFANGEPIGEDGIYWLKVHLANCGDFPGVSKAPFGEHIQWVEENRDLIKAAADAPMEYKWWIDADKPFLFLAACMELRAVLAHGPGYISHLPLSFDGSCSGLQHMCAMTRSSEGTLVNLTPNEEPQDVYQGVADRVRERIEGDLQKGDERKRHWAKLYLDWIWDIKHPSRPRRIVKTNVMTFFYGSDIPGMTNQQEDGDLAELIEPLAESRKIAKYVAQHVKEAIKEVITQPAEVMGFLRKLVGVRVRENLPLQWTTPSGFPWSNRYHEQKTKQVSLFLHTLAASFRIKIATGEYEPEIKSSKAYNGASPNFVHACDAAHLMLTVNAAVSEGITSIATVHDSFGCLASQASRFREIIREQFVRMYQEHDVLQEVFEQAQKDLGDLSHKRLKGIAPPQKGPLDLNQMLAAEYAFA
jgi:DNA-directed RNA polymerase, mitochondrial